MQLRFEILEDGSGVFNCPNATNASVIDKMKKVKINQKVGPRGYRSSFKAMARLVAKVPDLIDLNVRFASQFYFKGNVEEALAAALCAVKCAHLLMPKGFNGRVEWKHPGNRAYIMALKQTIVSYTDLGDYEAARAQFKLLYVRNPDDDQITFET